MRSLIGLFNRQRRSLVWLRYTPRLYHGAGCYGHGLNKGVISSNNILTGDQLLSYLYHVLIFLYGGMHAHCSWGRCFSQSNKRAQPVAVGAGIQGSWSLYGFAGSASHAYPVSPTHTASYFMIINEKSTSIDTRAYVI